MVNKKYIILKVREIISSELSLSDMNPELNFFDHGGDSVRAISICDRLKSQFSIDIELHDFFEFQAIKDIESRVISYTLEKIESTKDEVKNELSNDSLLLTSGQKQIFNYCSLNSKSTSNIISTALVINKRFSESELKNKLNDILNSNDIFKRRLTRQGNHLLFERKENHNIKLIVHNISYSEAIEYVEEDVAREMPLFGDELYEFQVFVTGEDSYIFYSRFHHIIIDGLSNVQFFFNLFSPSIKKATKDFDQYYFYEEKYLQSDSYKDSLNVWGEKISSYRGDLENSKILPKKINNQSVVYRVKYDDQLISKIDALNLVPNTSFFQKTLFIMSLSLAKVLNKDFQSIGISTHGRSNLKFLRTLGNFTNTLPLLLKYSGKDTIEQSFLHFLEEFNFLTKNQKMPLLEVVKEESKNSNFSLFNMIFSYLDLTDIYNRLDELGVNILEIDRKYSHTDLDMYVTKVKKELFFCFEFNEDFINLKEVKDLVENFVDILSSITSGQCNTTLGSLVPSLKKSDKKSILHGDISSSVPHFLDFITNSHLSDKIAIKSDQGSISYRDLIRRAYQVRNSLRSLGITSNERVAIYQERSIDYIVSMLGCMYNGNPYIPLDIGYPEERTKFILEDSKAKVIITSKHLSKVSTDVESLYFENILKEGYRTVSSSVINQSSVCYILYTSGSTGNPKGVEVTFSNLNNFLFSMASTPEMSSDDTLLAVTTFCFDISFLEIFLPLYCKSSLYLASSSESKDSQKIINIISKEEITVMQATPVTWSLLIKSGWKGSQSLKALCGGEKLDYSLAQNILSRVDSLWNMY
ncbi:AMP-binding protein, partial [Halobacteriovorax sp.]|uniref:AMP-binding protein n=1 Tax=Halobacteriovorax sp. TaxID=2020862 RepID=UPI00356B0600